MNNKTELKRELSRLTGIDMFNPKFGDVFNRYFPNDEDTEEKRLAELEGESVEKADEVAKIDKEEKQDNGVEEVKDTEEDINKAEDEREIDKIEEEKADNSEKRDEKAEEVNEESEEIGKKVDDLKSKYEDELFDAKLELELVKNNVREDKLEPAKRYLKYELEGDKDLTRVGEILKEFPEWLKKDRNMPNPIGMSVDEVNDDLTAEERRLKQIGINPR